MKLNFISMLGLFILASCQYENHFQNYLNNSEDNFAKAYRKYENESGSNLRFLSEEESEQCRMRPNTIYSEPFGFIPTLLGKLYKQGDVF
jgi:hypothetical protein